jgi:chromosomal replication initiation ATPase DnaA
VQQVLNAAGEQMDRKALLDFHGLTVKKLLERVAAHFNVATSERRSASKVRRVSSARAVFCHLAVRVLGASVAELPGMLGLSIPTASKAVSKGGEPDGLDDLETKLLVYAAIMSKCHGRPQVS